MSRQTNPFRYSEVSAVKHSPVASEISIPDCYSYYLTMKKTRQATVNCFTTQLLVEGDPNSTDPLTSTTREVELGINTPDRTSLRHLTAERVTSRSRSTGSVCQLRFFSVCSFSHIVWVVYSDGSLCDDALWRVLAATPPPSAAFFQTQIQPTHIDTGRQNTVCTHRHGGHRGWLNGILRKDPA